jgi:dTDP-4-amino-4,6-dideoxygalactose transaminase
MPALEKILYSGYIAEGEAVKEFEMGFGEYIGNYRMLSMNSGTAALHVALILAGVKPGDEVISTVITAEPTNVAILQAGAKLVWADVDYDTGVLSVEDIERKITPRTKAIMVVHYAGIPADIFALQALSVKYNIPVIEDAAHALGAKFNGRFIGTHSPFVIYSLQAIKHLTTVDGGMLALADDKSFREGRLIRWFGIDKNIPRMDNDISLLGYKYHMNNVNATIGLIQLKYIDKIIGAYKSNGQYFDEALKGISGIDLCNYYPGSEPSYWLYTMKVENRDSFIKLLEEHKIMASTLHLRNDKHSIFKKFAAELPNVDSFYSKMIHIPCGWWVDHEKREYIASVIKKGW